MSHTGTTATGTAIPTTNGYAFGLRHQRLEWHGGYHALGIQYGLKETQGENFTGWVKTPVKLITAKDLA